MTIVVRQYARQRDYQDNMQFNYGFSVPQLTANSLSLRVISYPYIADLDGYIEGNVCKL